MALTTEVVSTSHGIHRALIAEGDVQGYLFQDVPVTVRISVSQADATVAFSANTSPTEPFFKIPQNETIELRIGPQAGLAGLNVLYIGADTGDDPAVSVHWYRER